MSEMKDLTAAIKALNKNINKKGKDGTSSGGGVFDSTSFVDDDDDFALHKRRMEQVSKLQKEYAKDTAAATEATEEQRLVTETYRISLEKAQAAVQGKNDATAEEKQLVQELEAEYKNQKESLEALTNTEKGHRKSLQRQKKAYQALKSVQEDYERSIDTLSEAFEGFTGTIDHTNTVFGALSNVFAKGFGSRKTVQAMDRLNLRFQHTFSVANMAATAFAKLKEVTIGTGFLVANEFQSGITSFNKSTGLLDDTNSRLIENSAASLYKYGVTFEDTSAVLQSFANSTLLATDSFNSEAVIGQVAALTKLGVSAETVSANMEILTRSFGNTEEEAIKITSQVAQLGVELKTGVGFMTQAFSQALPRLALYTDDVVGQFSNIAKAATKAGLSVDDMIGLGEQFQTFEGAATAAGRLNALMGGGFVDNITLMEKAFEGPEKAALYLQQQIKAANMNVETMGSMTLKALGEAIGINDATKLKKFLKGDLSAAALQDPQVSELKDLNKMATKSMSLQEKQMAMQKSDMIGVLRSSGATLTGIHTTANSLLDKFGGMTLALGMIAATLAMQGGARGATSLLGSGAMGLAGMGLSGALNTDSAITKNAKGKFTFVGGRAGGYETAAAATQGQKAIAANLMNNNTPTQIARNRGSLLGSSLGRSTVAKTTLGGRALAAGGMGLRFLTGTGGIVLTAAMLAVPAILSALSSEDTKSAPPGVSPILSPTMPASQQTTQVQTQRNQAKHNHNQEKLIESVKENTAEIKRMNKLLLQQGVTVRVQ